MYDKPITLFEQTGVLSDTAKTKETIVRIMEDSMRADGFLPVLDLGVGYFTSYDLKKDVLEFKITIYGMYVGREKAEEWQGLSMGKLVHKDKLDQLLVH